MPNQHSPHQKGISKMNYTSVKLVREGDQPEVKIDGPEQAAQLVSDLYHASKEKFMIIALDSRNKVNAIQVVSIGTLDASLAHPREVFQVPLLTASASIVLAHNHPSGDPTPSQNDIKLTKRLKEAGKILGISVHDHIILGKENTLTSMKKEGLM